MQKVVLLGDSIRMFYQAKVKELLGDGYEVWAPEENCRFSYYALNSLRHWLPQFENPDIIHWNIGLWDLAILYPEDGCFISKAEYVRNMTRILRELKKTGAKIIFATTTPVSDEKQFLKGPMPPANRNEDIIEYNKAVLKAFEHEDIEINDLHSLMYPNRDKYLRDDMVHPNEEGVALLGKAVADKIKKFEGFKNSVLVEYSEKTELEEKIIQ